MATINEWETYFRTLDKDKLRSLEEAFTTLTEDELVKQEFPSLLGLLALAKGCLI